MKKLIFMVLFISSFGFAQNTSQLNAGQVGPTAERARLFKSYTNFSSSNADTTGWITVNLPSWTSDPLLCSEVRLLFVATDSIANDIVVYGRNGTLTSLTATYVDSVIGTSNTSNTKVVTLRAPGTDRLAGCTQIKISNIVRATGTGTTSGRTLKEYILYKFP